MKQIIVLNLEPAPAQHLGLLRTMEAFNQACQHIADVAYQHRIANKIALQPLVYNELRARYHLSSQMVVRAISKACEVYKVDKRIHPRFDPHDAMIFDGRILSVKGLTHVSLLTLTGRLLIPFRFVRYQPAQPNHVVGQADLILTGELFTLEVCVDLSDSPDDDAADPDEESVPMLPGSHRPHPGLLPPPRPRKGHTED